MNFPNITPNPVTIPIPLNVEPNPPEIVEAISPIGIPTKIDVTNDVINNAINALSLNFIIETNNIAIANKNTPINNGPVNIFFPHFIINF